MDPAENLSRGTSGRQGGGDRRRDTSPRQTWMLWRHSSKPGMALPVRNQFRRSGTKSLYLRGPPWPQLHRHWQRNEIAYAYAKIESSLVGFEIGYGCDLYEISQFFGNRPEGIGDLRRLAGTVRNAVVTRTPARSLVRVQTPVQSDSHPGSSPRRQLRAIGQILSLSGLTNRRPGGRLTTSARPASLVALASAAPVHNVAAKAPWPFSGEYAIQANACYRPPGCAILDQLRAPCENRARAAIRRTAITEDSDTMRGNCTVMRYKYYIVTCL